MEKMLSDPCIFYFEDALTISFFEQTFVEDNHIFNFSFSLILEGVRGFHRTFYQLHKKLCYHVRVNLLRVCCHSNKRCVAKTGII